MTVKVTKCGKNGAVMNLKQQAANFSLKYIQDGMVVGLGSGSTTQFFIDMVGERFKNGDLKNILAIATSEKTASQARSFGIPLTNLLDHPYLDLVVDGADQVDPQLNLIKGLGRALLREKIIEIHARRFIVIVDESKLAPRLGNQIPLPVEIVKFEAASHVQWLNTLGCRAELWEESNGSPVVTDNGNFLARCWFDSGIPDPTGLARVLADRPGILEHGLFLGMATDVVVAGQRGIRVLERGK
jgi:ribose 5-phosphate isomerase A